jgi:transposase
LADLETFSREELIAVIVELRRQVEELRRENEELRRRQGGSAAPFSRGTHKANPKPSGRKPGEGPFLRREEPAGARTEPIPVAVQVPCCAYCSGALEPGGTELATVTDMEEMPGPVVQRYEVEIRRCLQCGRPVRGRHADLPADQHGATAHRLGPRVKAAAHALHYHSGVPLRKVPAILKELTGIEVTQSALTQDALKRSEGLVGEAYEQLRAKVKDAPVVHTDDTGWRTAGGPAQLMVFETDRETVFQIRSQHRNEEVREVIPADFAGVMVTDRGKSYDAVELSGVAQQKCLSHLIRNASAVVNKKSGPARQFGTRLKELLRGSIQLWRENRQGDVPDYEERVERMEADLTHHLRNRALKDDDNQRLLNGIGGQNDRGNVLRFLHEPGVEPTNNRAERALRPAVIARKVSQCSKNERGAYAFAAFVSLAQTSRKNPAVSVARAFLGLSRNGTSTAASLNCCCR